MPLLGGDFDSRGCAAGGRATASSGSGSRASAATSAGARPRWWIDETAVHHHTGLLRKSDTKVPLERIEGLDVHQGPLQRAFGVFALDVQTGAGKKGGEIALPALTPAAVEELRAARGPAARSPSTPSRWSAVRADCRGASWRSRRSPPASSACCCRCSPSLGQVVSQVGEEEQARTPFAVPPALGDRGRADRRRAAAGGLAALDPRVGDRVRRLHDRARRGADPHPARAHRPQRGDGAGRPRARRAGGRRPAAATVRAVRADRRGHRLRRARPARPGRCSRWCG